jgi:hypothetical protein
LKEITLAKIIQMDKPRPPREFKGHARRIKKFIDYLKEGEAEEEGEGPEPFILILEKILYEEVKGDLYYSHGPSLTLVPLDLIKATSESSEIREALEEKTLFLTPRPPKPRDEDQGKSKAKESAGDASEQDNYQLDHDCPSDLDAKLARARDVFKD